MLALYRAGRQAEALRAFQRAREALVDALGVDPGPELRDLESAILAHDDDRLRASRAATIRWSRFPPRSTPPVARWWVATRSWPACVASVGRARDPVSGGLRVRRGSRGHRQDAADRRRWRPSPTRSGAVICFARCDRRPPLARARCSTRPCGRPGARCMRVQADARIGEPLGATIARRLAEWAALGPVLVVLDDLHEAETEVLEVVAEVAELGRAGGGPRRRRVPHGSRRRRVGARAASGSWCVGGLERDAVHDICELYGDAWTAAEIDEHPRGDQVACRCTCTRWPRPRRAMRPLAAWTRPPAKRSRPRRGSSTSQQAVADEVVGIQRVIEQQRVQLAEPAPTRPRPRCARSAACSSLRHRRRDVVLRSGALVAEVVARLVDPPRAVRWSAPRGRASRPSC